MKRGNFWIRATMIVGFLEALRMLLFGNSAPRPIADGRLWFVLILAVLGTMLWSFFRGHRNVFLGMVAIIGGGAFLLPIPLLWPFGASTLGTAFFATPNRPST